jgi:hypothetical protein
MNTDTEHTEHVHCYICNICLDIPIHLLVDIELDRRQDDMDNAGLICDVCI